MSETQDVAERPIKRRKKRTLPPIRPGDPLALKMREDYEKGLSTREIAGYAGITRDGVRMWAMREGWKRPIEAVKTRTKRITAEQALVLREAGSATPDVVKKNLQAEYLNLLRVGASAHLAVAALQLNPQIIMRWIEERPEFGAEIEAAKAAAPRRALAAIDKFVEMDWKAAQYVLSHHPLTRDDWRADKDTAKPAVQVVIKFDREEGVTIEQPAQDAQ